MLVGNPVVFMLGGETLATLDAEWHSRQILKFDPRQVETIHLTWPGTGWSFDLARAGSSRWSIVGPVDVPGFDAAAADAVVSAAADLATSRYLQYTGDIPSGVGLTPPRLDAPVLGGRAGRPIELAIGGAVEGGRSYASAAEPSRGRSS